MNVKHIYLILFIAVMQLTNAQSGIPVYSDYLSDNYYLLHPSMAGAANCAKLRLTARNQWFGQPDAPALQTLSYNGAFGEKSGAGVILFNDKNGYHAQKGMKVSYAHHLLFSRDYIDLNMLSFGISAGFIQSSIDERIFDSNNPGYDPAIGNILQRSSYFNMDIGASYNFLDFYAHLTVKNVLASKRDLYTGAEPVDLRRVILNSGYTFGDKSAVLWEPSFMFQYVTQTNEKYMDFNMKAYKEMDFGMLWGGLSYRTSLDGAQYIAGNAVSNQRLQYVTPIVGLNFGKFMFSYLFAIYWKNQL